MIDPILAFTARAALALLFAAAAWHKLRDRNRFEAVIRAYRMVPRAWEAPVASVLPAAEALVAIGLCYSPWREAASLTAIGLLSLYTFAIAANLAFGNRDVDCGCFASDVRIPLTGWLVVRNGLLIAAAALIVLPVRPRALVWVDALTVAAALVTLSLVWSAGRRLAQTGPALRGLGDTP